MWIVFSLLAALSAAIVVTLTKIGVQKVAPTVAFAVQSVLILLVAWTTVFVQGRTAEVSRIEPRTLYFLIAAGVLTTFSSLFSFQAIKLGAAGQAGTLDKVSIVFVVLLAWLFLKEKPSWPIVLGTGLMVSGAIVIALAKKLAG